MSDEASPSLHGLFIMDDVSYFDHQVGILKARGVKMIEMPSFYDSGTIVPFLITHDHSILIVRNPSSKADLLRTLKGIMCRGLVGYKGKTLKVSLTLWVLIDSTSYLMTKLKIPLKGTPKRMCDVLTKDYGQDFMNCFDIFVDTSSYTNSDILGRRFL
jgi:hypothetical protein